MRSLPAEFRSALKSFASSPSPFRVIWSTSGHRAAAAATDDESLSATRPDRLYVLDSSFNPPTRGHRHMALSALKADASPAKHLLLLLATRNADKADRPAVLEQRLAMMGVLADDLVDAFAGGGPAASTSDDPGPAPLPELTVHVGVVKHPYFVDKAQAIAGDGNGDDKSPADVSSSPSSSSPPSKDASDKGNDDGNDNGDANATNIPSGTSTSSTATPFPFPPTRQTHLVGFDTLTRLLDPKYYPPAHDVTPLAPLFARHAVRVTARVHDGFGSRTDQERYLRDIADGKRRADGADPAWARKIELVDGPNDDVPDDGPEDGNGNGNGDRNGDGNGDGNRNGRPRPTSSTRARDAAARGDRAALVGMCGERVADWILAEKLYKQ